jgi:hypothetical protein
MTASAPDPRPPSALRRSVSEATGQIQEIVDAAERVAEEIRAGAEADAAAYLEERRRDVDRVTEEHARQLAELADSLAGEVEAVRQDVRRVTRALEDAIAKIRAMPAGLSTGEPPPAADEGAEPAAVAASPPASEAERQGGPRPVAYPGRAVAQAASSAAANPASGSGSEEPLLRATQMAVAGSERAEIEDALRREFGIADPGSIADQILGPGGG